MLFYQQYLIKKNYIYKNIEKFNKQFINYNRNTA